MNIRDNDTVLIESSIDKPSHYAIIPSNNIKFKHLDTSISHMKCTLIFPYPFQRVYIKIKPHACTEMNTKANCG